MFFEHLVEVIFLDLDMIVLLGSRIFPKKNTASTLC